MGGAYEHDSLRLLQVVACVIVKLTLQLVANGYLQTVMDELFRNDDTRQLAMLLASAQVLPVANHHHLLLIGAGRRLAN